MGHASQKAIQTFTLPALCCALLVAFAATPAEATPLASLANPAQATGDAFEPVTRGTPQARVHDGFYSRVSAGSGAIRVELNPEPGQPDPTADGAALSMDWLVGGTPVRGATLGGALLLDLAPSMAFPLGVQAAPDAFLAAGLIGPFVDAHPDPTQGWHFGGMLGLGALSLQTVDTHHHRLLGFGGSIWGGKDFWIGDEWSLGAGLRIVHTQARGQAADIDVNAFSLSGSLMLTAVHH